MPLNLNFCVYMGHDPSSPGLEGQGQGSVLGLVLGLSID